MWFRMLGFIAILWMALTATFMFFIPLELASLSPESLAQLPASRMAFNYVLPVYDTLTTFGNSLASNDGWIMDAVLQERSAIEATLNSTACNDADNASSSEENPAIGTERDLGFRDFIPETISSRFCNAETSMTSVTTPVVMAVAYLPDLSSLPPTTTATIRKYRYILQPIYCGMIVHDIVNSLRKLRNPEPSFAPSALDQGHLGNKPCLCDQANVSALHSAEIGVMWKHAARLFRRYLPFCSAMNRHSNKPIEPRLQDDPTPCGCAVPTSVTVASEQDTMDNTQHPSIEPQVVSRQSRSPEASNSSADDTANSVPTPRPVVRIHDCGIDDPNWRLAIYMGVGHQSRQCQPTYEPWQLQLFTSTRLTAAREHPSRSVRLSGNSLKTSVETKRHWYMDFLMVSFPL